MVEQVVVGVHVGMFGSDVDHVQFELKLPGESSHGIGGASGILGTVSSQEYPRRNKLPLLLSARPC